MRSQIYITITVVVTLMGLGGVLFFFFNQEIFSGEYPISKEKRSFATTSPRTLREMLMTDAPMQCRFSVEKITASQNIQSSGVVFAVNGNLRQDIIMTVLGTTTTEQKTHIIIDANRGYLWHAGIKIGFSAPRDLIEHQEYRKGNPPQVPIVIDEEGEFICETWKPDLLVFLPSTKVRFIDISPQSNNK